MKIDKLSQNKYSNAKGDLGVLLAKGFLKKYFKGEKVMAFDVHRLTKLIPTRQGSKIDWERKLGDEELIKKEFFKEDISKIVSFMKKFSKSYLPDLWVSINGKLHVVEVKTTTSYKKTRKELHSYQRKDLLRMNKHFPVSVIYIKIHNSNSNEKGDDNSILKNECVISINNF